MPVLFVRLKIRVRLSNGCRSYVDPIFSSNGKLKPLYAVVNGKPEHHPEGVYIHRDKELLINPLSLYWLHTWWGADWMYLRMRSVLQDHNELEGLVLIPDRDA
jgi:hypothetical protein